MPSGHLLVVDDEPAILGTLKKALTLEGYRVDVAGGAKLADSRVQTGVYDLVLLDVALPDGDGVDLLGRWRSAGITTPVVMMSGHATIDLAVKALQLGATDFLEKPLSTDRLLVVIDNTLRLTHALAEKQTLRKEAGYFDELIGTSGPMRDLTQRITRVAPTRAAVLITGERGTGKELVAKAIHRLSPRRDAPLEKLNCAAVPRDLFESELFGHESGAFTGATKLRRGKFERANGGTLFLDEVGDMPLPLQAKLLRVLQEQEIERVGGSEVIRIDVRVVAATNKNLAQASASGEFRADLLDRLNVVPLELPPLRARRDDIIGLASHFLDLARESHGRLNVSFQRDALQVLTNHSFPGNVRELRNLVERLVILTPDDEITAADARAALGLQDTKISAGLYQPGVPFRVLVEEAERNILTEALQAHQHQMAATARTLGLERSHLYKKLKALGLRGNGDARDEDARADEARSENTEDQER
jgi:DNA-binding NtrC family response regulator